ncbi:MAG: GAF domain-containing SpoIIE family protein phosphatase, partial [Acidobacteriota bacterium]
MAIRLIWMEHRSQALRTVDQMVEEKAITTDGGGMGESVEPSAVKLVDAGNYERALLGIAKALNDSLTLETALSQVLELTVGAIDADAVSLFVTERFERQQDLKVSFARRGGEIERGAVSVALGLSEHVLRTGESIRVDDVSQEPRFKGKLDRRFGTRTGALMAVPLQRREHRVGLVEAIRESLDPFTTADLDFLKAVADELAVAVENARLVEQLHWDLRARELMLGAARKVGSSLDLDEVLDDLLTALLELIPYDAGGIYLLDHKTGGLYRIKHRGYRQGTEEVLRNRPGSGITGWAVKQRQGVIVGNVKADPRYIEARPSTRSEIAVPIVQAGRVIGVITLESDHADAYSERQLILLEMIGAQVASAITNARFFQNEMDRLRLDRELELSREIQSKLFPSGSLRTALVEATGINVPSSVVGGDYYDYFEECARHLGLAIADVSGHGLSASLLMAAVRSGVHLAVGACKSPASLASQLNRLLYDSTPSNQYVAAVVGLLDAKEGRLRYCNAGHVPPLLISRRGHRLLEGGGLILGAFAEAKYQEHEVLLRPGDMLVFYTDGLTEMTNAAEEQFGLERLAATIERVKGRSLDEIIEEVRRVARAHRRGLPRQDDITLMLVRLVGPVAGDRGASPHFSTGREASGRKGCEDK